MQLTSKSDAQHMELSFVNTPGKSFRCFWSPKSRLQELDLRLLGHRDDMYIYMQ